MAITGTQKICAAALVATLVLYALVGFYLLPYLIREKAPVLLKGLTGQSSQLQAVRFNPFKFVLELENFALAGSDGKNLISFDDFVVDFNALSSIRHQALVFDNIVLRKPLLDIKRRSDGSFNFSGMLPKTEPEKPAADSKKAGVLPLILHSFGIQEGRVSWFDAVSGQELKESLLPVNLTVTDLTTQSAAEAGFDLGFVLESGGHLHWQGELGLTPLTSKGKIDLEDLRLTNVGRLFLQKILPVQITEGRLNLKTEYHAGISDSGLALNISNGQIDIKEFAIAEKAKTEPLLAIPLLAISGISADLSKHEVKVTALTSRDAQIMAALQADGRLNYQAMFAPQDAAQPPPGNQSSLAIAKTGPDWQVSVGEIALKNYQLLFTDQTQKTPQISKLSNINVNLHKFSTNETEKLPLQFNAVYNDAGKLKLDGDIAVNPLSAALTIDLQTLKLKNFQKYLDSYLNLEIVDGEFNSRGNLQLRQTENLQLTFQGDANIDNLITRDKVSNKDFLKWHDLQLQQIDVDLAKQAFSMAKVVFDRPYLRFNIKKDKTNNVAAVIVSPAAKSPSAAQPVNVKTAAAQPQPSISIGKIELKDGHSDFSDYSLILPFVADMDGLNGEVNGFYSNQDTPLKLTLQGKVYDLAQVVIKGSYQIKSGDSNIDLKFSNMPLPLITPYMAEFAGYKIEKGQMALELQYKINKGRLEARNKIFIDQLTLGDQVENPHASSLPLKFAIALLKDADGKINLDFPITGSLDDPQFSVGALIVDVLENLISKLVTSPFRALGGLFDDDDQDFSAVNFPAGSAELKPEETAKLDKLSLALQNKPGLTLEVKGMAFQSRDWEQLRFEAVKDILKKMKSGELRDKGEKVRSEYIELSDEEYKRLLAKFYVEVFPLDSDKSLLGAPRIKSQPDADFYAVARQKLESVMPPDPQRLTDLAVARANAISKYLVENDHLDMARIYILAPELDPADTDGIISKLSLNASQ
jgi:uncharacterized protein involved in outer membrane biogenesis